MELQLTASQLKEVSTVGVSTLVSTVTIHYIPFFFLKVTFSERNLWTYCGSGRPQMVQMAEDERRQLSSKAGWHGDQSN